MTDEEKPPPEIVCPLVVAEKSRARFLEEMRRRHARAGEWLEKHQHEWLGSRPSDLGYLQQRVPWAVEVIADRQETWAGLAVQLADQSSRRHRSFALKMTARQLLYSESLGECARIVCSNWVRSDVPGHLREAIEAAAVHAETALLNDKPDWADVEQGLRAAADVLGQPQTREDARAAPKREEAADGTAVVDEGAETPVATDGELDRAINEIRERALPGELGEPREPKRTAPDPTSELTIALHQLRESAYFERIPRLVRMLEDRPSVIRDRPWIIALLSGQDPDRTRVPGGRVGEVVRLLEQVDLIELVAKRGDGRKANIYKYKRTSPELQELLDAERKAVE